MKVSDLARNYVKCYIKFLCDNDISVSQKDAYDLFRYVVGSLHGKRSVGVSPFIVMHYSECLKEMEGVGKEVEIDDEDKLSSLIEYGCVYVLVSFQYLSGKVGTRVVAEEG